MTPAQSAKARHTAGRLEVLAGTVLQTPGKKYIGRVPESSENGATEFWETRANAARLAACWNYCEGVDTETLQSMERLGTGVSIATNYARMEAERDALRAEIERLREALQAMTSSRDANMAEAAIAFNAEPANNAIRSALNAMLTQFGMDEDEWNTATFKQARAALAKAAL